MKKTNKSNLRVLMLAAENGALPGGKVGGMGDVVRDIPIALSQLGVKVDIVIPGYQHFSLLRGAKQTGSVTVNFRGEAISLGVYRLPKKRKNPGVQNWVIDHPMMAPEGPGKIYCDDAPDRPFATDASKFALFCLAAAQAIKEKLFQTPDVIHLHDWHSALLPVLAHYHPDYLVINRIPMVYTIHNLSLQGVRPFSWDDSALENWYRPLRFDYATLRDPVYENCYNPMRAAINLCVRIHAVSPNYVKEIQQASDLERGFVGGERLESDLKNAASEQRLVGILNGCEYPQANTATKTPPRTLRDSMTAIRTILNRWRKSAPDSTIHNCAYKAIDSWLAKDKARGIPHNGIVLTSIGRLSDQKMRILLTPLSDGRPALEHCLDQLDADDIFILLGSGGTDYERALEAIARRNPALVFLHGYSDRVSETLYDIGDLFLMPSSFEPCGIGQMLAMRSGQPCLVHHVGGLVDTVEDGVNGFAFVGDSPLMQATNMVKKLAEVRHLMRAEPGHWKRIQKAAKNARFSWQDSAEAYLEKLYNVKER